MLVGRETEQGRIDALLDAARAGRSGVLVLIGEPGIGKTTLLRHAVTAARGLRVLEARGTESESELAFSGLSDLLGPVVGYVEELPPPQAQALSSALALGETAPADRFAVAAATLGVLAAAAEDGPLLAIVDDAQWPTGPPAMRCRSRHDGSAPRASRSCSRRGPITRPSPGSSGSSSAVSRVTPHERSSRLRPRRWRRP